MKHKRTPAPSKRHKHSVSLNTHAGIRSGQMLFGIIRPVGPPTNVDPDNDVHPGNVTDPDNDGDVDNGGGV